MATSQSRKIGVFPGPIYFVAMPFGNGMGYAVYMHALIAALMSLCVDNGSIPYFAISQGTLPSQPNHLWTSSITQPKKLAYFVKYFRIYWTYFHILFTIWKLSMYRWWLCTFFSKFGQLLSSILGVHAVKKCNFCRHAPAILGRSSYVTWAFQNSWKIAILISPE